MLRLIQRQSRCSGQTLVEFALALPFVVLIIVAIMYFGRIFYVKQAVLLACQEGARELSKHPGLSDSSTRSFISGFSVDGEPINPDSVVYGALGSARLLSSVDGTTGNLPKGTSVKVLPFDSSGEPDDAIPAGTIALKIEYPFRFFENPFSPGSSKFGDAIDIWSGWGGNPVHLLGNFTLSERVVVVPQVYQVNLN